MNEHDNDELDDDIGNIGDDSNSVFLSRASKLPEDSELSDFSLSSLDDSQRPAKKSKKNKNNKQTKSQPSSKVLSLEDSQSSAIDLADTEMNKTNNKSKKNAKSNGSSKQRISTKGTSSSSSSMEASLTKYGINPKCLFERKRPRKPEYWKFIKLVGPSIDKRDAKYAKQMWCELCCEPLEFSRTNSTKVKVHLQTCHQDYWKQITEPEAIIEMKNERGKSLRSYLTKHSQKQEPCSKKDKKELDKRLLFWIAGHMRPMSVVSDIALKLFIDYLQRKPGIYHLPSATGVADKMTELYDEVKAKVKTNLSADVLFYSLTTDMWTSRALKPFLSLTIHYVSRDFVLFDKVLEVIPFTGRHTGSAISVIIKNILTQYSLPLNRCNMIVRDNGSNIINATNRLCNSDHVAHMGCFAHTLHLVLMAALQEPAKKRLKTRMIKIKRLLIKVRKGAEELEIHTRNLNSPCVDKLNLQWLTPMLEIPVLVQSRPRQAYAY